ncbi:MAG: hypothetical protein IKI86_04170 [Firmicutes bacterium]|nr:hypothetical protein [Bacillota bacterium]MBR4024456.1 hypothetical protein [Bacillota bacterium]
MDKNKPPAKSHKTGISLLTIVSVAFTVIGYFNTAADFWDRLDSMGIKDALTGSSLVLILAAVAVIFSFIYLISSGRAKRNAKKALVALAKQAEEAKARGEEFTMPERTVGDKVGSAMSTVLDAITKTIILVFILCLIGAGVFVGIKVNEINNRPTFDALAAVEIDGCVEGYDGLGYVVQDKIVYNIPDDITEIYKDSKNYKKTLDYSEQNSLWYQVRQDLTYTITPDTSEGGTLSNGDVVTVKVTLPGYSIPKLQSDLNIKITGIDESKEYVVEGLPHKFNSAEQAVSEQSGFISAACDKVRMKAYENCDNFMGTYYSDYELVGAYLCKPKVNPDTNPDALLVLAQYKRQAGTEYASQDTVMLYAYPFDSNTNEADLENEFVSIGEDKVRVVTEIHTYAKPEQIVDTFSTGIYLSGSSAYELYELPFSG